MFGYQIYPTITKNLDLSKIGLIKIYKNKKIFNWVMLIILQPEC